MAVPKVVAIVFKLSKTSFPTVTHSPIVSPTSAKFTLRSSAQCVGISSSTAGNSRTNPSPPESPFHLFILLLERRSGGGVHLSNKKGNQPLPYGQTVGLTEGRPVPLSTLPQSCATETCRYQSKLQRIRTVSNNYTKSEFKRNAQLDKKDFGTIEYMLRRGYRQLEIYTDPGIRNILR